MKIDPKNVEVLECSIRHYAQILMAPALKNDEFPFDTDEEQVEVEKRDPKNIALPDNVVAFRLYDRIAIRFKANGQEFDLKLEADTSDDPARWPNISPLYIPGGQIIRVEELPLTEKEARDPDAENTYLKTRMKTYLEIFSGEKFEII